MTGDEIRKLRERKGLNRQELAEAINVALGTAYEAETIARWERGRKPAGKVHAFLEELAVSDLAAGLAGATGGAGGLERDDEPIRPDDENDTAPGDGAPSRPATLPQQALGSAVYAKACEELVELVATGVGMIGAATGNVSLLNDGAIIAEDKAALGAAYGKLAEQNDTFRRMLVGMTEGGTWLQVALVTGTTLSKCWQNHQIIAAHKRAADDAGADNGRGDFEPAAVA